MRRRAVHRLRVPAAVPAWALRALAWLVLAGAVLVFVPDPGWWIAPLAAGAVWAVVPQSLAIWAALVVVPVGMLLADPDPGRTAFAVFAVHAVHVLASLSSCVPAATRVAPAALRPSAVRFLVVQAVAQPIGAVATLLPSLAAGPGSPWLAVAGAASALALVPVLLATGGGRGDRSLLRRRDG